MALPLVGSAIVHLDRNTFMWVQLTHFLIDPDDSDTSLLASLIASPGYEHDYASSFQAASAPFGHPIHARWRLSAIRTDLFEPSSSGRAHADLDAWANEQDWTEPAYRQPPEVEQRLQTVYALLRSGVVYKLRNPAPEDEHDYGDVTGGLGFHEFVVIDRERSSLHVIVASDD